MGLLVSTSEAVKAHFRTRRSKELRVGRVSSVPRTVWSYAYRGLVSTREGMRLRGGGYGCTRARAEDVAACHVNEAPVAVADTRRSVPDSMYGATRRG
eukprot:597412-Rhodomonas_salina.1